MSKTRFSVKSSNPILYDILKQNARRMRNNPTLAEFIAWNLLHDKKIGFKFRRQHIIGDCIVDFINLETGLIIEIDGGYHACENQINVDEIRTDFLKKLGYTLLRFKNEEVICNPDYFIDNILKTLKSIKTDE